MAALAHRRFFLPERQGNSYMTEGAPQSPLASATLILLRNLQSEDPATRQSAAMALGRLGDPGAVPGLLAALRDENSAVRQAAAWALGQIGDARAAPGLTDAMGDPDPHVRRVVSAALGWIGGEAPQPQSEPHRHSGQPGVVRKRRRRSRHRTPQRLRAAPIIIVALLIALFVALVFFASRAWNAPLGPELVSNAPSGESSSPPASNDPAEPTSPPLCGGPLVMYLLVVGSDTHEADYESGFADVIRIIRVDFVSPSATLLAIPRDLWVQIPGLEPYGIIENRVKTAYAYGNHYNVPGGGVSLLAQTLAENFDLRADHYVVVNFPAFEAGIDAIGGIDVNVPEALSDPLSESGQIPAGWQHMDGPTALRYARIREDIADLPRVERQTQVILAIRERVLSPQILSSLPGLVESTRSSILTDLSPAEISALLCIGEQMTPEAIRVISIDNTIAASSVDTWGHEVLTPDYEAIAGLVRAFNAGDAP